MNILIGAFWFLVVTLLAILIFRFVLNYQINKLTKAIYEKYGAEPPEDDFIEKYLKTI